jgi:peptide-methionine (S)-S-oxide reductase
MKHLILLLSFAVMTACNAQNNSQPNQKMTKEQKNLPTTAAPEMNDTLEYALVGGGCFWCVEAVYQRLQGVTSVQSGYAGGHVERPSYAAVCEKTTGHAEVALIGFNPKLTTYTEILEVFFRTHNPTTLNQQGNDVGPQYRSEIFYLNDEQKAVAEQMIAEYAPQYWDGAIVTAVTPFINYYPAEDYHQNYFNQNGGQGYCVFVVKPKVDKFEKEFKDKLKKN